MIKLSILIPTIKRHTRHLGRLTVELSSQILPYAGEVEVLIDDHETDKIGTKRNRLLDRASGKYLAFVDSDDRVSDTYIKSIMEGIEKDVDCCSLKGVITFDGNDPEGFEHSLKYDKYETVETAFWFLDQIRFLRFPNHLNTLRSSIVKQFRFPETNWGEDTDIATQIHNSGLLKTEHYIPEVIYFYDYVTDKTK